MADTTTLEWANPYEVATEIGAARTIGPFPARVVALVLAAVFLPALVYLGAGIFLHLPWRIAPMIIALLVVIRFAIPSHGRRFEDMLPVILRHWSLPRRLEAKVLEQAHVRVRSTADSTITADDPRAPVRAVIEIDRPVNLRLLDHEDVGSYIRRFATFLNGLRFPVHLVIRTTPVDLPRYSDSDPRAQALNRFLHTQASDLNLLDRHWYVAVSAATDFMLRDRCKSVLQGVRRAGLQGHRVDGKLRVTLNGCWSAKPRDDGVGPHEVRRLADHVEIDGQFARGLVVQRLPRSVDPNWLASLLDGEVACDVSLWINPLDIADEARDLDIRIGELAVAQGLKISRTGQRNLDWDAQIQDAQRVRHDLARHRLRLFDITLLLVVRGQTREELDSVEVQVRDLLREQIGEKPARATSLEHDLAVRQVVPLGEASVLCPIKVETPALARTYVWSSSSLAMAGGVPWGVSTDANRPVLLDPFAFPNAHMVCFATSGAGKGYSIKVLLYRWFWLDPDVSYVIIDQDEREEYSALARAVGGQVYHVADAEVPAGKWHGWLQNGTWHVPSINRLRVYNLSKLDDSLRPLAIQRLIEHVERLSMNTARTSRRFVIVIDELWTLLDPSAPAHAGATLERLWRKGRHGRIMAIGISQRPSDALNTKRGEVLLDISAINWFLWCKPTEMSRVSKQLGLTSGERSFLEEADQGMGILTVPGRRLAMRIATEPDGIEDRMART